LFLVRRGTPTAIDVELESVAGGSSCCSAQRTEQIRVELGYTRDVVIEDRRAVGDGTVSLAKRTKATVGTGTASLARRTMATGSGAGPSLARRTRVLTSEDVDGWRRRRGRRIRRGRGRRQLVDEGCRDRRDDDE
jgi:hypothetical protein